MGDFLSLILFLSRFIFGLQFKCHSGVQEGSYKKVAIQIL